MNPTPGQPVDGRDGRPSGFGCQKCGAVKLYCANCVIWRVDRPTEAPAQNVAAAQAAFNTKHAGCSNA